VVRHDDAHVRYDRDDGVAALWGKRFLATIGKMSDRRIMAANDLSPRACERKKPWVLRDLADLPSDAVENHGEHRIETLERLIVRLENDAAPRRHSAPPQSVHFRQFAPARNGASPDPALTVTIGVAGSADQTIPQIFSNCSPRSSRSFRR
jgi:hypothetical protein